MKYKIVLSNEARRGLKKIRVKKDKHKISIALKILEKNPFLGKKLKGNHNDQFSFRVWPYRIVYEFKRNRIIIFVVVIGQRGGGVYK